MRERPILFSAPMVRAILDGSKTQTRRLVKPAPQMVTDQCVAPWEGDPASLLRLLQQNKRGCPYGQPGDRLWVRETWMDLAGTGVEHYDAQGRRQRYAYGADTLPGSYGDEARKAYGLKWRPSIHMPRAASRMLLGVTSVSVERLQGISEADAIAEGIERRVDACGEWAHYADTGLTTDAIGSYRSLWELINGPASWKANPWVWVVEFKQVGGDTSTRTDTAGAREKGDTARFPIASQSIISNQENTLVGSAGEVK